MAQPDPLDNFYPLIRCLVQCPRTIPRPDGVVATFTCNICQESTLDLSDEVYQICHQIHLQTLVDEQEAHNRENAAAGPYKPEFYEADGNSFARTVILACGHFFCHDCIVSWLELNHNCPMCKNELQFTLCKHNLGFQVYPVPIPQYPGLDQISLTIPELLDDLDVLPRHCNTCLEDAIIDVLLGGLMEVITPCLNLHDDEDFVMPCYGDSPYDHQDLVSALLNENFDMGVQLLMLASIIWPPCHDAHAERVEATNAIQLFQFNTFMEGLRLDYFCRTAVGVDIGYRLGHAAHTMAGVLAARFRLSQEILPGLRW